MTASKLRDRELSVESQSAAPSPSTLNSSPSRLSLTSKLRDRELSVESQNAASPSTLNSSPSQLSLTEREREVLALLVTGKSRPEVGELLQISEHTVTFHVRGILEKTGARTLLHAAHCLALA